MCHSWTCWKPQMKTNPLKGKHESNWGVGWCLNESTLEEERILGRLPNKEQKPKGVLKDWLDILEKTLTILIKTGLSICFKDDVWLLLTFLQMLLKLVIFPIFGSIVFIYIITRSLYIFKVWIFGIDGKTMTDQEYCRHCLAEVQQSKCSWRG